MPHSFEVADRIHIHHLGRLCTKHPMDHPLGDVAANMTGVPAAPEQAVN